VYCVEPPVPTYDPPRMHGAYRVFPESYVGPLTYEDKPDTAPAGVVSDDRLVIRESSLYLDPPWLPEGYALSSITTNGYDSEHVIAAVYTGPGDPIRINRVRQSTWPIDLILPVGETLSIFEAPLLEGVAAILYYPKPGSLLGSDRTVLSFVEGDTETTVMGDHLARETAVRIGLSLICGASCAASQDAVPPVEPIVGGTSAPESVSLQGSSTRSRQGAGTSEPGTLTLLGDEHRVIAGLNLTSVIVTSWWDHSSDYGEAALDLQHPSGESYTSGVNVYVSTWPWSGTGRMYFTTQEYRHDPSYCDGRYVELKDTGGNVLGWLTYVHLASQAAVGDTWYTNVAQTQDANCVPSGYHAHLHQGQTADSQPSITYNTALPGTINPTNDVANNWMFKVTFTSVDSDGDGVPDANDNCPAVYNPGQQNTDSACIPNGANIAYDCRANPHKDALGDACDSDDDNDWMLDTGTNPYLGIPGENVGCGSGPTNALNPDTDGDRVLDGGECLLGSNPKNAGSKPNPRPPGDGDADGLPPSVEYLFGSSSSNSDSDGDGPGINDGLEVKGWATSPISVDTDGDSGGNDGCKDDKQIVDVNGDGYANLLDLVAVATISLTAGPFDPVSKREADINRDGVNNISDVSLAGLNSNLAEPHAPCP